MKKIILLMAGIATFAAAQAQHISVAPEAGLNLSNVWLHDTRGNNDDASSGDPKLGLKIGGLVDIGLNRVVSLQPGLYFSQKGYRLGEYETNGVVLTRADASRRVTLNYLEIPLNVMFKFGPPRRPKFFVGAGVYAAYAVGGKVKYGHYLGQSSTTTDDLNFGDDDRTDDYRNADFGGQVFMGFLMPNGGFLRAQYQAGVANIDVANNDDYRIRNSTASLTLGMMFGGHRR